MVVVDRLTKYIYMILTIETINVEQIVNILLRYVIANHGMLSKIILDRDKLFILKM